MNLKYFHTSERRPTGRLAGGFTLVELLVVIAIIAILATMGLSSFQSSARSGRDGKRKGDLSQIRASLELYRSQAGIYPSGNVANALSVLKAAGYMSDPLPVDPKSGYSYSYTQSGATYCLCAHLENTGTGNSSTTTCNSTAGDYYCATQP